MQIYTRDKTSPRSFTWLWYLRLVAFVVTFIVLGITVANTVAFHDIGCNAPGRLNYNLAVVCPYLHPSVKRPLTFVPSRSSLSSLSSISSSPRAHPAPPGFFHGSYGVSSPSMPSCSSSGSPLPRPQAIAAPTYATLAASMLDTCSSIPSLANAPPLSSNEIIHQAPGMCCSREGAIQTDAGQTRLWVDRSR